MFFFVQHNGSLDPGPYRSLQTEVLESLRSSWKRPAGDNGTLSDCLSSKAFIGCADKK